MEWLYGSLSAIRLPLVFVITSGSLWWWYLQPAGSLRNPPVGVTPFEAFETVFGTYALVATVAVGFACFGAMIAGIAHARVFRTVPLEDRAAHSVSIALEAVGQGASKTS